MVLVVWRARRQYAAGLSGELQSLLRGGMGMVDTL